MSHFSKVKGTKVTDVEAFVKACATMGMTKVKKEGARMVPWAGPSEAENVDVFCSYPGSQYGIGLQKQDDGTYVMVSDWSLTGDELPEDVQALIPHAHQFPGEDRERSIEGHGVARAACDEFRGIAMQRVAKETVLRKFKMMGFSATESESKNGDVNIKLQRF